MRDLTRFVTHYEVPGTWTWTPNGAEAPETIPARLLISRGDDDWVVAIVPEGWSGSGLWLCDRPGEPWGFWRLHWGVTGVEYQRFRTADGALDAAVSTPQVGVQETSE